LPLVERGELRDDDTSGNRRSAMPLKEDIERLLMQEEELRFRSFDEATAFEIGGR
jgi:hypothetical protein